MGDGPIVTSWSGQPQAGQYRPSGPYFHSRSFGFYCDTCKDAGLDPHHDHVVDAKTGREFTA